MKTQNLVENEAKASPEGAHAKIDAHRGEYEEPLGHERLYQQGN